MATRSPSYRPSRAGLFTGEGRVLARGASLALWMQGVDRAGSKDGADGAPPFSSPVSGGQNQGAGPLPDQPRVPEGGYEHPPGGRAGEDRMDGRGILRDPRRDRTGHRRHPAEGRHRGPHRVERRRVALSAMDFTEQQIERYSRHIILPDVGGKGQKKLAAGRVLVIGAGGLGSPAALYLAAAGIGTIGLVDGDVVDLSNLQRQILHSTDTVGKPKVESGRAMLNALNPDVTVNPYPTNIGADNIMEIVTAYDLVLDGSDN